MQEEYKEKIKSLKLDVISKRYDEETIAAKFDALFGKNANDRDRNMFELGYRIASLEFIYMMMTHIPD